MTAEHNPDRRKVLVTGATDGLGLHLVRQYSESGAEIIAAGRKDADQARAILPTGTRYVVADQSDPARAARAIRTGLRTAGWENCDIAILNAGTGWAGDPQEEQAESIIATMTVNLTASILIARTLSPLLFETRKQARLARLALIGSTAHSGAPGFASYAASKAGLHGFARSLREEWRGRALVQVIHPGPIDTAMHDKAGHDAGGKRPAFLHPDYVARAVRHAVHRGASPVTINHLSRLADLATFGWIFRP
jgi:NAD(P)-dependent dehydrogenase (short-subunit alcohol dehydrogenase family)